MKFVFCCRRRSRAVLYGIQDHYKANPRKSKLKKYQNKVATNFIFNETKMIAHIKDWKKREPRSFLISLHPNFLTRKDNLIKWLHNVHQKQSENLISTNWMIYKREANQSKEMNRSEKWSCIMYNNVQGVFLLH